MTWRRLHALIAWFTSAVRLVRFAKSIGSSRLADLIWELVRHLSLAQIYLLMSMFLISVTLSLFIKLPLSCKRSIIINFSIILTIKYY